MSERKRYFIFGNIAGKAKFDPNFHLAEIRTILAKTRTSLTEIQALLETYRKI